MLLTEFDEEKDWAIIAKGYKEIGYEEGIEEGKKTIIKTMLSNGGTKETIIKLTGFSEKDFDNLFVS
ncbi:MAG: hypothetical protein J6Z11_03290 [Candidatus Riflebacteria bacterium]|nr:hypothetical protein [Candidatus Riflebacteria bacterium]